VESDPGSTFPVWDEWRDGALCASGGGEQPGSLPSHERAGMESASVLAVWIVGELWCWSLPGSLKQCVWCPGACLGSDAM
jgi:hypothetical protein